jgi:diguanylate cyclase (GGDEF)-like protein
MRGNSLKILLILMDLDFFKKVNDTYGHPAGDQALIFVATVLKEVAGGAALPVRYAGDESIFMGLFRRYNPRMYESAAFVKRD